MSSYATITKTSKTCLLISVSAILLVSIVGFREMHTKETPCSFTARIVEVVVENRAVRVEKIPVSEPTEKEIVVLTDEKTRITHRGRDIDVEDLEVGMCIVVEGFEWFRGKHGRQVTIVLAQSIRPVFH